MSNIEVITKSNILVVDSRLIAGELGVEHRAFRQTIEKYLDEIQEFGVVTFEMSKPPEGTAGGRPERFCYLNEDQATYTMSLSRNTDKVRQCKRNLVKAFSEAKKIIQTVIPQQSQEIERLKLELELVKAKTYYMDRRDAIAQLHGTPMLALLDGRPDAVVEKVEKVTETIVVRDGRSVSFEGKSTAQVGKELGFRTGKEFERWLDKIGRGDLICQGLRVNQTPYIPTENLATIKRVWQENRGKTRQLLIGE